MKVLKLDVPPYIAIEVSGGVAYLVYKPKGIKVIIRDYDNKTNRKSCSTEISPAKEQI